MTLRSEIGEQPDVIAQLLARADEAGRIGARLARARHVTFAARGSSDNAATYGKYLFESVAGIITSSAAPSLITRYGSPPSYRGGAVIGISQSGAAPDVRAVVAAARRVGAATVAITNDERSALAKAAASVLALRCGPERSVAATKTYTASCVALALLASGAARARRRKVLDTGGLVEAVAEATARDRDAARLARRIGIAASLVVLGRGYAYAAALEAALKIKELARVWAEPYSSADFAHGPRTLLERGTPVLILSSRGKLQAEARLLAGAMRRRGASVYAITDDERLASRADDAIVLRARVAEPLAPIALVVVAQLLAAHVARRHGRDPERPAGLSKVTRTL